MYQPYHAAALLIVYCSPYHIAVLPKDFVLLTAPHDLSLNRYGGADPYEPSPSAPAGHPDSGNGDPEGLGWAAVPEIPGSIPASHAAGADVNGSATTAAKSYKSSRRRLQDAGDYPGNAPDQEAPVPIVHAELAAATPYYPPGQRYTPQPLPQQQPPGVRYFPL